MISRNLETNVTQNEEHLGDHFRNDANAWEWDAFMALEGSQQGERRVLSGRKTKPGPLSPRSRSGCWGFCEFQSCLGDTILAAQALCWSLLVSHAFCLAISFLAWCEQVQPCSCLWQWPVVSYALRSQNSSPQTIQPMPGLRDSPCCVWLFFSVDREEYMSSQVPPSKRLLRLDLASSLLFPLLSWCSLWLLVFTSSFSLPRSITEWAEQIVNSEWIGLGAEAEGNGWNSQAYHLDLLALSMWWLQISFHPNILWLCSYA